MRRGKDEATDCTDDTDKESEIFVNNKTERHRGTETVKPTFYSQFF